MVHSEIDTLHSVHCQPVRMPAEVASPTHEPW